MSQKKFPFGSQNLKDSLCANPPIIIQVIHVMFETRYQAFFNETLTLILHWQMLKRGNQTAGKFWARNGLIGDLSARYNILVAEWSGKMTSFACQVLGFDSQARIWVKGKDVGTQV